MTKLSQKHDIGESPNTFPANEGTEIESIPPDPLPYELCLHVRL